MANVETEALPARVAPRAPFATLLLWAVLEHFHDPFAVLAKLTANLTPDATLDPDHAVLGETFAYDARFGRLLRAHDLGDFLVCVARRISKAG